MTGEHIIRVGTPTLDGGGNPYLTLLYAGLQVRHASVTVIDLRPWRLPSQPRVDVLHLHWPEHVMAGPGTGAVHAAKTATAAMALRSSVRMMKARGVRIVWTAHNLRPHNPSALHAQVALYPWLARTADAVIVHTKYAANLVREVLDRTGPMYLAPHGNYLGAYAKPSSNRQTLRMRHGFSDSDHILLAFGQLRDHKRLPQLAHEFVGYGDPRAHLVIAGAPKDPAVAKQLEALARENDRIHLKAGYIPDEEVAELYTLADLAIFNYSEIFSSGALMLSLSLGCAALIPKRGAASEIVERPALFAWDDSPFEVLHQALAVPPDLRRHAALGAAEAHSWDDAARIHIAAYLGMTPNV